MATTWLNRLSHELPWRQCNYAGHSFKLRFKHTRTVIPLPRIGLILPGVNDCINKNCLCSNKIEIDYKNARFLSQFTSPITGNIFPRTLTRVCRVAQWKVAKSIKKARCAAQGNRCLFLCNQIKNSEPFHLTAACYPDKLYYYCFPIDHEHYIGLMPIVGRDPRYSRDPPLFY